MTCGGDGAFGGWRLGNSQDATVTNASETDQMCYVRERRFKLARHSDDVYYSGL